MKNIKTMLSKILKIQFIFIIGLFWTSSIFSISIFEITKKQHLDLSEKIRKFEVIIRNIGSEEDKQEFTRIKKKYLNGFEFFLQGTQKVSIYFAFSTFYDTYIQLLILADRFTDIYIERSLDILIKSLEEVVDINIKYSRSSFLVDYFYKDINPEIQGIKLYSSKEVHKYKDKARILNILKNGYKYTEYARILYTKGVSNKDMEEGSIIGMNEDENPDTNTDIDNLNQEGSTENVNSNETFASSEKENNIQRYKSKEQVLKEIGIKNLKNFRENSFIIQKRLDSLLKSIDFSRKAKQLAMFSYQIINRHMVYCSQIKHYDSPFYLEKNLLVEPLFDERIPKKYIVDFVDAFEKDYEWEKVNKIDKVNKLNKTSEKTCNYGYDKQDSYIQTSQENSIERNTIDTEEIETDN